MAQLFISTLGWRAGYIAVGATTWLLSFGMISIFVREPPGYFERMRAAHAAGGSGAQPLGFSVRDAILGTPQFTILFVIFLIEGTANNGILSAHFVPMLLDRGYSVPAAIALLGTSGLAAMLARVVVGLCLDWVNGPCSAASSCSFRCSAWGCYGAMPASPRRSLPPCASASRSAPRSTCSASSSAAIFGRRSFGALYGLIFAAFTIGIGVGPAILGFGYDHFRSYDQVLFGYVISLVVAALLFLPLGKYNYPKGSA